MTQSEGRLYLQRIDQDVVRMTILLWAVHWGILVSSSAAAVSAHGSLNDNWLGLGAIRLIVSIAGAGSTLLIYAALRRRAMSPVKRLMMALSYSAAMAVSLAFFNELMWLFANFYDDRYAISAADILNTRCNFSPSSPCGIFISEGLRALGLFIWIFIAWSGLYVGLVIAYELRDRERRLAIAESAAHQSQLSALRLQLNPHFLFNTLNTLSGLVAVGRKALAEELILNLSKFMRYSLAGEPDQLNPLTKELEAQRLYLDIERVRFSDRLVVTYDISAEAALALVPSFLLQPLVENAIKYAVAPSESEVVLSISAWREDGQLVIRVNNSEPDISEGVTAPGLGIGLSNVRKRLDAIYRGCASLHSGRTQDGGWSNELRLPWKAGSLDESSCPDRG